MSEKIEDMETTVLPIEDYRQIKKASRHAVAHIDDIVTPIPHWNGRTITFKEQKIPYYVSAYRYLEELAKDPSKGSEKWKTALMGAGIGAGASTLGFGTLVAATGPLAPFAAIGLGLGSQIFGNNRACTLLIGNERDGDLVKHDLYIDCGIQTGRPVYEEEDLDTGRTVATNKDTIPGLEDYGDGYVFCGLGMYRFEKDLSLILGFYGTGGAISFRCTDPKVKNKILAISWLVPETGKPAFGVCADLGKYDSLEDFYDKTAGARKSDWFDKGTYRNKEVVRIRGSMIHRLYPEEKDEDDLLLTVTVS